MHYNANFISTVIQNSDAPRGNFMMSVCMKTTNIFSQDCGTGGSWGLRTRWNGTEGLRSSTVGSLLVGFFSSGCWITLRNLFWRGGTERGRSMLTLFSPVIADLVIRVAKDKFGAIQSEYQKVSACDCAYLNLHAITCSATEIKLWGHCLDASIMKQYFNWVWKPRSELCPVMLLFWKSC